MQKKIKVLVVDGIYPPAYTGSGLRAHRTYKRLSSNYPIEFAVLTTTRGGFDAGPDEYDGVRLYRTKANKSLLSQIIQTYRLFNNYRLYDYDVLHGFGNSLVVLAAALLAKYHSLKLILEITLLAPVRKKSLLRSIKYGLNFLRFGFASRFVYRNADLVIALNEYIKQHYLGYGINENKIWFRPNPVDISKYYVPDSDEKIKLRRSMGLPENKMIVLVVGRFESRKNQMFAIETIRLLPDDFFLVMVGPTDISIAPYLKNLMLEINKNGTSHKVSIFPEYREDIEKFFRCSDILWIPSRSEGTPNVMLEASCCGIPVLVNRDLGLNEFISEGNNGYQLDLTAERFQSMTLELKKNIDDKQFRDSIAKTAQNNYGADLIDRDFIFRLNRLSNSNST
jgi:glycosyltransferase involved in cell wall biosynthesis